ncbi:hypothetical protein GF1_06320 [Desulfolithobacter dissulfuricans]|uniref:Uncharacterized protein n=1 Tax=Desulfolithobacter dissulfuricans TaxID=2795293 RepID=A0A915U8R1_9BACT|nr:hypothetical protein [Desulfolithobacter dissulfuricans]BCO08256.1 hypothetical protein GF1_06320 [Desulfolithobacter dissulfuricans]
MSRYKKYDVPWWWLAIGLIGFIINIRVAAEIATPFERAIDGLAAGGVLLTSIYYGCLFFGLFDKVRTRRNVDSGEEH